jgi:hypothetical protein
VTSIMKPKAKNGPTLNSTKKAIKRKIITLKTTKEINNSVRLFAQNTQKLNQQRKMKVSVQFCIQERNNTQDATVEKNENMKKDKKPSPTSNTNKKQI